MGSDYAKNIAVLGSTGSIGTQALEVVRHLNFRVSVLAAARNVRLLEQQARIFRPEVVAVFDVDAASELRRSLRDLPVRVLAGDDGVCEAAAFAGTDIVLSAISGIAGLLPVRAAIEAGRDVALATKEAVVCAGEEIMRLAAKKKVRILPVDSEHSAIFQALACSRDRRRELKRVILTASGGPFFGKSARELENVTPEQALRHPNWSMGQKISVDSATLMNKGLEVIEAVRLFSVAPEAVEVVVHRQSIVHSMVEFCDGSVIAQMGAPDMRTAIQYALTYPRRLPGLAAPIDFAQIGSLTFSKPDTATFKCLELCYRAVKLGGAYPAALNAANEEAVSLFLRGRIPFLRIADIVEETLNAGIPEKIVGIEDIIRLDKRIKDKVRSKYGNG